MLVSTIIIAVFKFVLSLYDNFSQSSESYATTGTIMNTASNQEQNVMHESEMLIVRNENNEYSKIRVVAPSAIVYDQVSAPGLQDF